MPNGISHVSQVIFIGDEEKKSLISKLLNGPVSLLLVSKVDL